MKKYLFVFCVILGSLALAAKAEAQILVIANSSVKVSEVSKSDLVDVFTGASASLKGNHKTPVLLIESVHHELFLRQYIAKSDGPFRYGWKSLVFAGQAALPKSLPNDAAVVDFVKNNQGAIGYIGDTTPHQGVNVLIVK